LFALSNAATLNREEEIKLKNRPNSLILNTMPAIICKDLQLFPNNNNNNNNINGDIIVSGSKRSITVSNNNNYNIHVDSRVVRGNTFASTVLTANQKRNKEVKGREESRRRLASDRTNSTKVSVVPLTTGFL
jgi:hypothetical protein